MTQSKRSKFVDFRVVKTAVTMEQVLGHYSLTDRFKRGDDSLSGPCPIHKGTNPTQFRVSLSKNCWNCFGNCRRGGNILDFVSLMEGVSIREAAVRLAEWFNVQSDKSAKHEGPKEKPLTDQGQPSPALASKRKSSSEETGPNKPLGFVLQNLDGEHMYLADRGLNEETVAEFGLGFCNSGSMAGRIVIPIHNAEGKLVAYAGRWPGDPPEDTPKYKLPAGFRKSEELFNLHRAREADPETPLVIIEGFFDCIHLWQLGIQRVVALMGTQLSDAQARLLSNLVAEDDRIVLMLDEDDAGRAARVQLLPRLGEMAFVKVFCFAEDGHQPTDLSDEDLQSWFGDAQ